MSVFSVTGGRYSEWPPDLFRDAQWRMTEQPDDGDVIPDVPNDPVPEPEGEPE